MNNIEQKIPEGWSVKKLGDVAQVITGSTPSTSDKTNYGNEFLFVSPADIVGNIKEVTNTITKLSQKGFDSCRIIKKGSPLFVCIGSIGKVAVAGEDLVTNQQINACMPKKGFDNNFLYYQLLVKASKIKLLACEQVVPIINKSTFEKIKLLFPPLPEQEKIAEILGLWDDAIEKLSKLIEAKKLQKKGLMQKLLTGKHRLKGFSEPWKEVKLGDVARKICNKNKENCLNVVTISAQNGFINQEDFFKKSVSSNTLTGYYLIKKGDFGYNRSYSKGYPMGVIKRLNNYMQGVVSTLYICFRPLDTEINSDFFEQYSECGLLNKELYKVAQEGARNHGLLNISLEDFFSRKLTIPTDISEQKAIADVLSAADEEIDVLNKKLEALKKQKQGLMQQLLTGKIRVKVN
jgi:type I restriction enzyme S subunit